MRVERTKWEGRARVDITASLPDGHRGYALLHALRAAIADDGATLREARGWWRGVEERTFTIEKIDAPPSFVRRIVEAAIAAGCEAVQVERYGDSAGRGGYCAEEWRSA